MKVDPYESATFIEEMEETWFGLKPLYEQLHAYVRHKLNKHYGSDIVSDTDALPAHLLGNMWAQSWNNIDDIVRPYPNKPSLNVTGYSCNKDSSKNWISLLRFYFKGWEPVSIVNLD